MSAFLAGQKGPPKTVELASTKTGIYGVYVIAGQFWPSCHAAEIHYRLRLYDDRRAKYVLNETEVPREYVTTEGNNGVKLFEKDLAGVVKIIS